MARTKLIIKPTMLQQKQNSKNEYHAPTETINAADKVRNSVTHLKDVKTKSLAEAKSIALLCIPETNMILAYQDERKKKDQANQSNVENLVVPAQAAGAKLKELRSDDMETGYVSLDAGSGMQVNKVDNAVTKIKLLKSDHKIQRSETRCEKKCKGELELNEMVLPSETSKQNTLVSCRPTTENEATIRKKVGEVVSRKAEEMRRIEPDTTFNAPSNASVEQINKIAKSHDENGCRLFKERPNSKIEARNDMQNEWMMNKKNVFSEGCEDFAKNCVDIKFRGTDGQLIEDLKSLDVQFDFNVTSDVNTEVKYNEQLCSPFVNKDLQKKASAVFTGIDEQLNKSTNPLADSKAEAKSDNKSVAKDKDFGNSQQSRAPLNEITMESKENLPTSKPLQTQLPCHFGNRSLILINSSETKSSELVSLGSVAKEIEEPVLMSNTKEEIQSSLIEKRFLAPYNIPIENLLHEIKLEDETVSLTELLRRVRERNKVMYCGEVAQQLASHIATLIPKGKCRKNPPCPPPQPRCPSSPPLCPPREPSKQPYCPGAPAVTPRRPTPRKNPYKYQKCSDASNNEDAVSLAIHLGPIVNSPENVIPPAYSSAKSAKADYGTLKNRDKMRWPKLKESVRYVFGLFTKMFTKS